ncbi:hypothetical protein J4V22_27340, partial [Escherichia coli]
MTRTDLHRCYSPISFTVIRKIYRSAGFPDVAVVGILEDGIPWEMPYRCPDIVWNPYRRKFS